MDPLHCCSGRYGELELKVDNVELCRSWASRILSRTAKAEYSFIPIGFLDCRGMERTEFRSCMVGLLE
jgi:hypothetical protein